MKHGAASNFVCSRMRWVCALTEPSMIKKSHIVTDDGSISKKSFYLQAKPDSWFCGHQFRPGFPGQCQCLLSFLPFDQGKIIHGYLFSSWGLVSIHCVRWWTKAIGFVCQRKHLLVQSLVPGGKHNALIAASSASRFPWGKKKHKRLEYQRRPLL